MNHERVDVHRVSLASDVVVTEAYPPSSWLFFCVKIQLDGVAGSQTFQVRPLIHVENRFQLTVARHFAATILLKRWTLQ